MSRSVRWSVVRWFAVAMSVFLLAACASDEGGGDADTDTVTETPTGSAPADPDAYAAAVCGAVSDWMTSIEETGTSLQDSLGEETDLGVVQDQLAQTLSAMVESTDAMLDEIRALDAPDVADGERLHEELQTALTQVRAAFEEARGSIEDLNPNDPAAMGEGLQEFGASMSTAFSEIEDPFTGFEDSELRTSFEDSAACDEIEDQAAA